MSSDWPSVRIEEIAAAQPSAMATGPFGSSISAKFFQDLGVPVIRGSNLSADVQTKIDDTGLVFVSEDKAQEFPRCIVGPGDLVFTCWGTINQVGLIDSQARFKRYLISNKQMKLTVDRTKADPRFVYYVFSGPIKQSEIIENGIGSSVPGFNLGQLRKHSFSLPPLKEQQAIADFLDLFTDRIALLRETNTTLEAIAQALFKSWFVDFEPVHAKARGEPPQEMDEATAALFPDSFEESELGMIPKGWSAGSLGCLALTARKQIKPEAMTADMLYVGLEHIPRQSLGLDSWGTANELESAKSCFEKGDILFGKLRPYFHKIVIAPFSGVCSTDILVCKAKSSDFHGFVAMHLFSTELVAYANRLSNGAKMPRVNWKDLADYPLAIPPSKVALAYSQTVQPMFEQITENVLQAQTLAQLRDTLLPKLISGQLRLPEAEALLAEETLP